MLGTYFQVSSEFNILELSFLKDLACKFNLQSLIKAFALGTKIK